MSESAALLARAVARLPGGVNSPVRAFRAVGGDPPFIAAAEGAELVTADGRRLFDFIASWGAVLLGHADKEVTDAVAEAAARGTSFGMPTAAEVEWAELVCRMVPGCEMVRMVSSGTEACASAIRLARAATGRHKLVKFAGCYHGHADSFLIRAGSGLATLGVPDSPGVPPGVAADTLTATYNDLASVDTLLNANPEQVAAVVVEPVAGNMGCVPPEDGFLEGLRARCDAHGALLVLDEVMTGFRVGPAGAQGRYGVTGDLVTVGKVVGGGLPAAAYGGRADLMSRVSPAGPVYQAGTLSGNPIAVAAGLSVLRRLEADPGIHTRVEAVGASWEEGLRDAIRATGARACVQRVGGMGTLFFTAGPVRNFGDAALQDMGTFGRFFHAALERGVLLPPSAYEAAFFTLAQEERIGWATAQLADALAEAVGV